MSNLQIILAFIEEHPLITIFVLLAFGLMCHDIFAGIRGCK